jgi:hypothetical protein
MKNYKKGFVIPLIIAVIALLGVGGGAYVYVNKKSADKLENSLKEIAKNQVATTTNIVGNDRDEHGCIGSAGYSWCEAKNKCARVWEDCKINEEVKTASTTVKTTSPATTVIKTTSADTLPKTNKTLTIKEEYKTEGTTLCNDIPRNIDGYILNKAYVTNEPSQIGHTSYWNTKNGGIYTINPNESIILNYSKGVSPNILKVTAEIMRFENTADLQETFVPILAFNTNEKELFIQPESGLKGSLKVIYKKKNNLVEVVGENEQDITNISWLLMDTCINTSVFKTDTPKGFVAWRTKDFGIYTKPDYLKIADADITLNLSSSFFGKRPSIQDLGIMDSPLGDKTITYSIFQQDVNQKLKINDAIIFLITKSTNESEVVSFFKENRLSTFLPIPLPIKPDNNLISENTVKYTGNTGVNIKKISLRTSMESDDFLGQNTYLYIMSKNNTSFIFINNNDNLAAIESVVNNLKFD